MVENSHIAAAEAAAEIKALKERVLRLEFACDHLRLAALRSVDLAMSVAQLVNVRDQRSSDLIFRDMKQAIAEIQSWAPSDNPLVQLRVADE